MNLDKKKSQASSLKSSQPYYNAYSSIRLKEPAPYGLLSRGSVKLETASGISTDKKFSFRNSQVPQRGYAQISSPRSFMPHRRTDSYTILPPFETPSRRQNPNALTFSNATNKSFSSPQEKLSISTKKFTCTPTSSLTNSLKYRSEYSHSTKQKQKKDTEIFTERKSRRKERDLMIEKLEKKLQQFRELVIQVKNLSDYENQSRETVKPKKETYNRRIPERKRIKFEDFLILGCKGKGRFGEVCAAVYKPTGMIVGLKVQKKADIIKNKWIERFISEVKIQSYLNHANVVKLYGIFDDKENVYMVMEYMNEGNLYNCLRRRRKLNQKEGSQVIYNVLSGVTELHQNCIIHRDIKPENIVICMGVYKICDFGWSVVENDRRLTYCGTFDYVPPELLKGEQYNFSIDLWEVGIVSYEILTGSLPFFHTSKRQTFEHIANYENGLMFPAHVSEQFTSFTKELIRKNPEERTPAAQLLRHRFFIKNRNYW